MAGRLVGEAEAAMEARRFGGAVLTAE